MKNYDNVTIERTINNLSFEIITTANNKYRNIKYGQEWSGFMNIIKSLCFLIASMIQELNMEFMANKIYLFYIYVQTH